MDIRKHIESARRHLLSKKGETVLSTAAVHSEVSDDNLRELFEAPISYADQIRERVEAVQAAHQDLLRQGIAEGLDDRTLRERVAEIMNTGQLPRIILGSRTRSNDIDLYLLSGTVPPGALTIQIQRDTDGNFATGRIGLIPRAKHMYDELDLQFLPMLPMLNPSTVVNPAILDSIDARFRPPGNEPPPVMPWPAQRHYFDPDDLAN